MDGNRQKSILDVYKRQKYDNGNSKETGYHSVSSGKEALTLKMCIRDSQVRGQHGH